MQHCRGRRSQYEHIHIFVFVHKAIRYPSVTADVGMRRTYCGRSLLPFPVRSMIYTVLIGPFVNLSGN